MFKNYFRTALRNLRRQKTFTLINLAGMGSWGSSWPSPPGSTGRTGSMKTQADLRRRPGPARRRPQRATVPSSCRPLFSVLKAEFPEIEADEVRQATGFSVRRPISAKGISRHLDLFHQFSDGLEAAISSLTACSFGSAAAKFQVDPRQTLTSTIRWT
jgi:hypothetical protein